MSRRTHTNYPAPRSHDGRLLLDPGISYPARLDTDGRKELDAPTTTTTARVEAGPVPEGASPHFIPRVVRTDPGAMDALGRPVGAPLAGPYPGSVRYPDVQAGVQVADDGRPYIEGPGGARYYSDDVSQEAPSPGDLIDADGRHYVQGPDGTRYYADGAGRTFGDPVQGLTPAQAAQDARARKTRKVR